MKTTREILTAEKFIESASLRIVPVLDLKQGLVVRGIGGRREAYNPWHSPLCPSADPIVFAASARRLLGHSELYVADLGALEGAEPDWPTLKRLAAGSQLICDIGLRDYHYAAQLAGQLDQGAGGKIVIASETAPDLATVESITRRLPPSQIAFSFDWRDRTLLSPQSWLNHENWLDAAARLAELGVRRFLTVDLDAVGGGQVGRLSEVCQLLRRRVADAEIFVGGGVNNFDDTALLKNVGCDAVLVATALHRTGLPAND